VNLMTVSTLDDP